MVFKVGFVGQVTSSRFAGLCDSACHARNSCINTETVKKQFSRTLFVLLSVTNFVAACSQAPKGCEINGEPRESCSASWVIDQKGRLLVITWPDGEKSTIRPDSRPGSETVIMNEKDNGALIDNRVFYDFKNFRTGSVISVAPSLAGEAWSSAKVDLAAIEAEKKAKAREKAESDRRRKRVEAERQKRVAEEQRREAEQKRLDEERRLAQERWEQRYENPIAIVSVKQISEEFESNSVVAEEKYANQMIAVRGVIDSVDDSMFDQSSVTVRIGVPDGYQCFGEFGCTRMPDMSFASVSCSHKRSEPIIRSLRKGMNLEVRGIVYSESTGIRLKNCRYYKDQ